MSGVFLKRYSAPPVDRREILRYAGVRGEADELIPLLEECLDALLPTLRYELVYCELPMEELPHVTSESLSKHLAECERVVVFAATVGLSPDRLVARYARTSPTKALLCQAIGAERIEALCDLFCAELATEKKREGRAVRSRFSAGYGDLPLCYQTEIIRLLDTPKRIGLTLNESLLLSPTKSVTALVGIE